MLLLSPKNICVSLATHFVVRYKVSEVAKLNWKTPRRHVSLFSQAFTLLGVKTSETNDKAVLPRCELKCRNRKAKPEWYCVLNQSARRIQRHDQSNSSK